MRGTGPCEITLNTDTAVVANFASVPPVVGGGDSGSGGDGGAPPSSNLPGGPNPAPKPLHCKPGFKKTRVHGKTKCVDEAPPQERRQALTSALGGG